MGKWAEPVGIFWAWGGWGMKDYDYLTTDKMDKLGYENLYEKCKRRAKYRQTTNKDINPIKNENFHVHNMN